MIVKLNLGLMDDVNLKKWWTERKGSLTDVSAMIKAAAFDVAV